MLSFCWDVASLNPKPLHLGQVIRGSLGNARLEPESMDDDEEDISKA